MTSQAAALEVRMREVFATTEESKTLMSLPGAAFILAVIVFSEVGDAELGTLSCRGDGEDMTPTKRAVDGGS